MIGCAWKSAANVRRPASSKIEQPSPSSRVIRQSTALRILTGHAFRVCHRALMREVLPLRSRPAAGHADVHGCLRCPAQREVPLRTMSGIKMQRGAVR
jgi:hypothetical protein